MSNQLEIIKPGAVININLDEPFIKRLQDLTVYFSQSVAPEIMHEQIKMIETNIPLSEWGKHFETLLILLAEVERVAKEQQVTTFIPLPQEEAKQSA